MLLEIEVHVWAAWRADCQSALSELGLYTHAWVSVGTDASVVVLIHLTELPDFTMACLSVYAHTCEQACTQ